MNRIQRGVIVLALAMASTVGAAATITTGPASASTTVKPITGQIKLGPVANGSVWM